jgi:hypothetical protein
MRSAKLPKAAMNDDSKKILARKGGARNFACEAILKPS